MSKEIIKDVLGHAKKDVTDRYLKNSSIKKWIIMLSDHVLGGKVLTFKNGV